MRRIAGQTLRVLGAAGQAGGGVVVRAVTTTTQAGRDAEGSLARVAGLDDHDAQLMMAAPATGTFRRGNDR